LSASSKGDNFESFEAQHGSYDQTKQTTDKGKKSILD